MAGILQTGLLPASLKEDVQQSLRLQAACFRDVSSRSITLDHLATGSDGFMAVIKPLPDSTDVALVHLTPVGMIVAVNRGFGNLFGHDTASVIGKQVGCFVLNAASRDGLSQFALAGSLLCAQPAASRTSGFPSPLGNSKHFRLWTEGLLIS